MRATFNTLEKGGNQIAFLVARLACQFFHQDIVTHLLTRTSILTFFSTVEVIIVLQMEF